jgi:hypothetical protein
MRVSRKTRLRDVRDLFAPRRALVLAVFGAWIVVIARSAVFIAFPQSFFDSDQAIVGLMAKHLIEGRAFPLFFYGQTYLLGVEAWVAAPFFAIAGPTVAALHVTILSFNLAAAALLIVGLVRWGGLTPLQALVASLFFTLAPPFTAAQLVEANGANIGPFLYVPLLWFLRDRPLWFGAVLGIGVLNREFTIYAVPVLLVLQAADGSLFRAERLRMWLVAGAVFLAVWQSVDALKPYADLMGPGTRGMPVPGGPGSIVGNVMARTSVASAELIERISVMAREYFPRQIGAVHVESGLLSQGRDWLLWPVGIALAAGFLRALQLMLSRRDDPRSAAFGWYLLGVGVLSAVGYVLTRPVGDPIDRYMLLTIYGAVGIVALLLALEPHAWLRNVMMTLVLGWAAVSAADHLRLWSHYASGRDPDVAQQIADELVARRIDVAAAGYWRSYKLTFLSRERVKIASTEVMRITRYDWLAQQQGERLLTLSAEPCATDQPPVHGWYLCRGGR